MVAPSPIHQTEVVEMTFEENKAPSELTFSYFDLMNAIGRIPKKSMEVSVTEAKPGAYSTFVKSPFRTSQQNLIERFHGLQKSFIRESARHAIESTISQAFYSIAEKVAILDFEKNCVEITSDNTVKFTLLFSHNRILMISKPTNYKEVGIDSNQVLFSYFENRKLVVSNILEIHKLVTGFMQLLA